MVSERWCVTKMVCYKDGVKDGVSKMVCDYYYYYFYFYFYVYVYVYVYVYFF